jgi:hypothetical protein
MTGKMALIDETDAVGNFTAGELACAQKFLSFCHPSLDHILIRQLAGRLFEQLSEVRGTQVNCLSNPGNS